MERTMHRKKVKLKSFQRHFKNPSSTRSCGNHTVSTEMSPEVNKIYHVGMKYCIAQCKLCGKKFINEPYLHAHHERRHYGQPYHPQIVDGSAALLEVEIKYLKHRLSALECQLLKRKWQRTCKGKVKVTENSGDSETENKKGQTGRQHETSIVETKTAETFNKGDCAGVKFNKYEKEVEELKNMFFAQIKELKEISQQPAVSVSSEFVQTEDTVNIVTSNEKKTKEEVSQQPVPVVNESIQTDIISVDVPEKDEGELESKLEERESVWRLRLAKADEQHKQELKQIQDRLQQTYEEGNQLKQELEKKLKQMLLKLAALEEENTQLLQKQCHLEEVVSTNKNKITPSDNRDTRSDEQTEKNLNKNKTLLVKTNSVEDTIRDTKLLEVGLKNSYEKGNKIVAFEKDNEYESDFEISLPDGFKQKQNTDKKNDISRPVVGNFCEVKFENLKENEKTIEEQVKSPVQFNKANRNNFNNIMDFLYETDEDLIKTPVKKFNFISSGSENSIREVISEKEQETDEEEEEEDNDEEETDGKEENGILEDMSESGSSYSGSSENEDISEVANKPVFEFQQLVQRPAQEKTSTGSTIDLQYLMSEVYLQALENMQQCVITQPDMLNSIRQDVEEKLRHRLKQLGVDPDWSSLPQATFQSKMALLKHHQNITAKSKVGYFTQRDMLAKNVDTMKRNPKAIGNCKVMRENILGKLTSKVAHILKAYPKLANRANCKAKSLMETKALEAVKQPVQQNIAKIVGSSPKQTPIIVQDELLRKELEEMKMLQQSANKLKMYGLDEELSDSDSLSWSLSSVSKDISPGKGTLFHIKNKKKSAMKNAAAAASSGNIAKKRVLFAEDAHVL